MKPFAHGSVASKLFYTAHELLRHTPGVFAKHGLITPMYHGWMDDERFQRAKKAALATNGGVNLGNDWSLHTILWAAEHAIRCGETIVECGTNRGYCMRAVCELHPAAYIYCFDTFRGFPAKYPPDSADVPIYTDCWAEVKKTFQPFKNVYLIPGTVPDSLNMWPGLRIGLLHIDMNCAAPEVAAVKSFWKDIIPGGLVISDDYGHVGFDVQRRAWDALAKDLDRQVLALPTGQGMIIK